MKILYGVVGEGMGHAMRSRVVLEHLVAQGHQVTVMASGRAVDYLGKRFEGTKRIHGLHMIYEENRVRLGKTLWSNVLAGAVGLPKNIAAYFELIGDFRPDVVISDFESWTYLYGKMHRKPILSIDNMQIIHRCEHGPDIIGGDRTDFELAKAFVKGKLPGADAYFIVTFFEPPIRKPDTFLFPPLVRPEIEAAKTSRGEHLLVYQTAEGNTELAERLQAADMPCRVYGMKRGIEQDVVDGNVTHRPFSETSFIDDLASARGVVAGGGFTLMSECYYLGKPMLAVPLRKQFEQVLNARYLEKEGLGRAADSLEDPKALFQFVADLPRFEDAYAARPREGSAKLLAATDEFLDRCAAKLM